MTMFGADATQLAQPRGAGSAPIAPVQEPADNTSYAGVANLLGDLAGNYAKSTLKDQKKPWMDVRNNFQKELGGLLQQYQTASDNVTQNQVLTRTRQLYTKTLADGAIYGEEFAHSIQNTYQYMRTGSGLEEIEDNRKAEVKREQEAANELLKSGRYFFNTNPTDQDRQLALQINNQRNRLETDNKKLQEAEDRRIKLASENRSQTNFTQQQEDYAMKKAAQDNVGQYLSSGFSLLQNNLEAARATLNKDGTNHTEVATRFSTLAENLRAEATPLLQYDSTALSSFNENFDRMVKLSLQSLDPKNQTDDLKQAIDRELTANKYRIVSRPGGATFVNLNQMTNGLAVQKVEGTKFITELYNELDAAPTTGMLPSVTNGDTAKQKTMFNAIGDQMTRAIQGKLPNSDAAFNDGVATFEATLNSLAALPPGKQVSLAYVTDFLASPAAAEIIKRGRYNPEVAMRAIPVFENTYVDSVAKHVNGFLTRTVGEATYTDGQRDVTRTPSMVNTFRFRMDGDGKIVAEESRDPRMTFAGSKWYVASQVREAQTFADELGKTVRATAFLLGTTDYAKVWEDYRHKFLPGRYPTPDMVEQAKADGWDGVGFLNNGASWKQREGASGAVAK